MVRDKKEVLSKRVLKTKGKYERCGFFKTVGGSLERLSTLRRMQDAVLLRLRRPTPL
jgi:hypothetical protein